MIDSIDTKKYEFHTNDTKIMSQNDKNTPWWQPGISLFIKLSGWIGGPIIVAVFVGKFLDRKYGTEPWLFLATVGISFIISMIAMVRIGMKEMKKIEEENQKSKCKNQNDNVKCKN